MCFKKPKRPEKTPEDIAAEKELEAMRKLRKAQLQEEMADAKESRTEDAVARAMGFMGNRSLIKGGKGGAGFIGKYTRTSSPIIPSAGGGDGGRPSGGGAGGGGNRGTRPVGIPIMAARHTLFGGGVSNSF